MYARGLSTRDPSEIWPLHLFLDSVAERLRPASAREAVLLRLGHYLRRQEDARASCSRRQGVNRVLPEVS